MKNNAVWVFLLVMVIVPVVIGYVFNIGAVL